MVDRCVQQRAGNSGPAVVSIDVEACDGEDIVIPGSWSVLSRPFKSAVVLMRRDGDPANRTAVNVGDEPWLPALIDGGLQR